MAALKVFQQRSSWEHMLPNAQIWKRSRVRQRYARSAQATALVWMLCPLSQRVSSSESLRHSDRRLKDVTASLSYLIILSLWLSY